MSQKISEFVNSSDISDTALITYVENGQNFTITQADYLAKFGVTGSMTQAGAVTATPVLDVDGTVNKIRGIEDGPGILSSVSPENGLTLQHNISPGSGGLPVFANTAELQPVIRNLAAGSGMGIAVVDEALVLTASAVAGTGVVVINSASDFPAAVSGVRELVPTPGDSIVYLIAVVDVDMGTDRFTVTGGSVVMRGIHRTGSGLTSLTTGAFITIEDSGYFEEFVSITCPNAKYVELTNPSGGFNSFVNQNGIILDCDTLGTIDGAFVTSFRTTTIVDTQTGGLLWTGATGSQLNMSNCLALGWTGTLFDLGTATFNLIDIATSNRFISPAGTTILSGAAASANLNSGGRGLVDSNIFNGDGTALSGIDTLDLQWEFKANIFADGTTQNSRQLADAFLTSAETVTIGSIGVYVAVGGTNWSTDITDRFTVSTGGLATYIGLSTIDVEISVVSTVAKVGGGADEIGSKIAINGTVQDKTIGVTENATATGVTSIGLFTLATGDTVQIFVGNETSTANIIVSQSTAIIKGG